MTFVLYIFAATVMAAADITWFCLKLSKNSWMNYVFLVLGIIKAVLVIFDAVCSSQVSITKCIMECVFTGVIVFNVAILAKWKYYK